MSLLAREQKINLLIFFNILSLFYIVAWIVVPVFQNAANGTFFRLLFFIILLFWFITSFLISGKWLRRSISFTFLVFLFLLQILMYFVTGYGDMSPLDFVSVTFFVTFIYIGQFYFTLNNQTVNKTIITFTCVLTVITAITTLLGLRSNPNASRYLTSTSYSVEVQQYLSSLNIGGFDFIYSLTIILPALLITLRTSKVTKRVFKSKVILLSIVVLFILVIAYSNFLIAYILLAFALMTLFMAKVRYRIMITALLSIIILICITVLPSVIVAGLDVIILNSSSLLMQLKLMQIKEFLLGIRDVSSVSSRYDLITRSLSSFLVSPFFGRGAYYNDGFQIIGGHSQLIDDLARYGLMGISLYLSILYSNVRYIFRKMKTITGKNVIFFSGVSYLLLNLLNPAHGYCIELTVFLILPLWSRYLENSTELKKD